MRLFAIDPGNEYSAYCIMDDQYKLYEFAKLPNREAMEVMLSKLPEVDMVVIERVAGMGMPAGRELFETSEWVGRFAQEAEKKVELTYIYRREEKLTICGDSRAKDSNIKQALIDRFAKFDFRSGKGTKKNPDFFYGVSKDVWQAISVCTTQLDKMKEGERRGS